jgi:hypothetical protein
VAANLVKQLVVLELGLIWEVLVKVDRVVDTLTMDVIFQIMPTLDNVA